jgi:methionyl-tRNA formyltransferase
VRVAFLGNDTWSVPTLEALAGAPDVDVAVAITNPPRPAGRGATLRPTAVADASQALGVPVLEVDGVRDGPGLEALRRVLPDALVVVAYGHLLPRSVLEIPRVGTINLHFSLLPRWRGAAPVQRAILEGDRTTGVSVMLLDEGLDTGPVVATLEEPIRPDDDAGTLGARLARLGAPLVLDALRALEGGTASPVAQDESRATAAPKLAPHERRIDWTASAEAIERRVRALAPAPGATTIFRESPIKLLRARARPEAPGGDPGTIGLDPGGVPTITAGEGAVELVEIAPSGRRRMSGADWARGARPEPGERFV